MNEHNFETVDMVIAYLDSHPIRWVDHGSIIECHISSDNYCKMYTKGVPQRYMMANETKIIVPTFRQKWRIWKTLRKKRHLFRKHKWDLKDLK